LEGAAARRSAAAPEERIFVRRYFPWQSNTELLKTKLSFKKSQPASILPKRNIS
jgi:hypothetical protein